MSKEISPSELSKFIRLVASGIEASKKPRADLVASDIRCAIAAVNGDEAAVKRVRSVIAAAPAAPAAPDARTAGTDAISLRFSGDLDGEVLRRAAEEIAKRRPGLKGQKLQFSLTAKPAQ